MAETIKGINVVIGSDTSGLSKALSDVNKKSRDIQSELRQVERLLKLDPKNTELLAQKQKLLGDAVATTREKLDRLRAVQEQVNDQFAKGEISEGQYRAYQREVEATEIRLKELEKQAGTTKKSLEEIGKTLQESGKKISDAGGTLTKGVTVPLAALGGASLKAASDFESAFAGVRKTVDATEEEFAIFKQGMRDMAKEMPQAATEIARVGEAAGQLGIENDAILGFTKTMVNMGVATNMSSDDAAMALARLATITQMNQQDFDRLGATIVGLGNNLAATESEIVEMGLRLAGAGNVIGMTEHQILSFSGSLAAVGINAEAGGSAFSKLMINMANEVATGGAKLEKFANVAGMTATEFQKAFQDDAANAIVSFIEGLGGIQEAGGNVFGVLEDLGLTEVRLRDAILRTAGAGDILRESLAIGAQAWEENTALTDEAAERYKTLESRIQILWNRIKDIAITLGDALIPAMLAAMEAMQPLIDTLARMAEWFANLDPGMQSFIITAAAIAAALGPVLIVVGKVVTAIGTIIGVVTKVGAAIKAAGGVLAVLTGPIGLTIAAVTALAGAAFLIVKNWEPIKEFFSNLWDSVVAVTTEVWESIKEALSTAWQAIKDVATSVWESIANFFTTIWESITEFLKTAWDNIKNLAQTAFNNILNVIKPILEGWKKIFSGAWEAIKNIFAGALLLLINLVTGNFTELKNNAIAIWDNIKNAVAEIWEGIKEVFSGTLQAIGTIVTTAWNGYKNIISTILNAVWAFIKSTWNNIINFFKQLPSTLYNIGANMFNSMSNAISNTIGSVKTAIVNGMNAAINWLNNLPAQMLQIGQNIIQGLVNGIKNMVGAVGNAIKDVADKVTGGIKDFLNINSPSRVTMALGEDTGEGFALGIRKKISDVQGKARDMAAATTNALKGVTTPSVGIAGAGGTSNTYTFAGMFAGANFTVRNEMDIEHIADAVAVRFQGKMQRNTRGLGRG